MPATSLDGFHQTKTAQAFDELARAFVDAMNTQDGALFDEVLARNFVFYAFDGARSRTGTKKYFAALRNSFADLHFEVHENIGVLVEDDLIALRTIVIGTHTGEYADVPATGRQIQTSVSHFFRVRDDQLSEHWTVMDTYRILARIGAVPGVAATFQQMLGVPEAPDGIFKERLGTDFDAPRTGRRPTRDESRAVGRRLYDGAINTGVATAVHALAAAPPCQTDWPCTPTSWPKTTGSPRSASGTAR
jgi:steroid delta-isomerase-like uncharacterized protein